MTNAARLQTYALLLLLLLGTVATGQGVATAAEPAADSNSVASIVAFNADQLLIAEASAMGFTVRFAPNEFSAGHSVVRLVPPSGMDRTAAMLSLQRRFPATKFSLAE